MAADLLINSEMLGTIVVTVEDDGALSRITFSDEPTGGAGRTGSTRASP